MRSETYRTDRPARSSRVPPAEILPGTCALGGDGAQSSRGRATTARWVAARGARTRARKMWPKFDCRAPRPRTPDRKHGGTRSCTRPGPVAPRWPPQGAPQHGELAGQRRGKVQNAQCVPATAVAYCVRASPARSRRFSRRGATLNPLTIFPPLITSVGEHVIAVYGDKLVMQLPSCGSRREIDHSVRP